jgi:hypothetical protein
MILNNNESSQGRKELSQMKSLSLFIYIRNGGYLDIPLSEIIPLFICI